MSTAHECPMCGEVVSIPDPRPCDFAECLGGRYAVHAFDAAVRTERLLVSHMDRHHPGWTLGELTEASRRSAAEEERRRWAEILVAEAELRHDLG